MRKVAEQVQYILQWTDSFAYKYAENRRGGHGQILAGEFPFRDYNTMQLTCFLLKPYACSLTYIMQKLK